MTISTTINVVQYNGNGVTTDFSFPYLFYSDTHLQVFVIDTNNVSTLQTINTDYTVTGEGSQSGGTVSMVVAPASGEKLLVRRVVPLTQLTDYVSGDSFPADAHETALDLASMGLQQLSEVSGRAIVVSGIDAVNEVGRVPNTVIGFNSDGFISTIPFTESGGVTTASQVFDDTRQQSSQVSLDEDQLNIAGNDSDLATNAANINQNAQNILANATAINSNATALASTLAGRDGVYTDTGTANAYVLTSATEAVTAYADGQRFRFRPANDNTGASTVNVSGLGVKTISNASTGFIKAGNLTELEYIATDDEFRIVNTDRYAIGNNSFYISNGVIEQSGNYPGGAHGPTLSFPVPFNSSAVAVAASAITGEINGVMFHISSVSATSFRPVQHLFNNDNKTYAVHWIARGT